VVVEDAEIESRGNDIGPSSRGGLRSVGGSGSDSDCDGDCEVPAQVTVRETLAIATKASRIAAVW